MLLFLLLLLFLSLLLLLSLLLSLLYPFVFVFFVLLILFLCRCCCFFLVVVVASVVAVVPFVVAIVNGYLTPFFFLCPLPPFSCHFTVLHPRNFSLRYTTITILRNFAFRLLLLSRPRPRPRRHRADRALPLHPLPITSVPDKALVFKPSPRLENLSTPKEASPFWDPPRDVAWHPTLTALKATPTDRINQLSIAKQRIDKVDLTWR